MVGPLLRPDTWDDPPDALAQRVLRGGLVINSERNDYYLAPENLKEEQQFVRSARLQSGIEVTIFSTSVTAYVPPPLPTHHRHHHHNRHTQAGLWESFPDDNVSPEFYLDWEEAVLGESTPWKREQERKDDILAQSTAMRVVAEVPNANNLVTTCPRDHTLAGST
jgi:hypothetical protein